MDLSRRTLFKLACAGAAVFTFSHFFFRDKTSLITRILPVFVDVLIPADEQTPAATDLQVHEKIQAGLKDAVDTRRLIEYGCHWLEQTAEKNFSASFSDINDSLRMEIVNELAAKKPSTILNYFFRITRNQAMNYYYSDERSWSGLGLTHAPQPVGYANYNSPPA